MYVTHDPSTGQTDREYDQTEDVDGILTTLTEGFGSWSATDISERARILLAIADTFDEHIDHSQPLGVQVPLLGASFVLPSMFPELADSEVPPKEITIECVSERRCFSTLNEAAPVGTAGRHFINAQLYAFGQRPEAVARELHALRQLNEAAKIQSDHKEVITALLIAAGEPLEGEHAQIAADAAEKHQRYQEGGKSFLAVAGIMGGIAVLFGAFALFLRLRVRSIRSLLSLTGGQRRLVTKEVGEQIPGS